MPYPIFDRARLAASFSPDLLTVPEIPRQQLPLDSVSPDSIDQQLAELGRALMLARNQGGATIFLLSAGVIQAGVAAALVDLLERGLITQIVIDGLAAHCDWRLAKGGELDAWTELGNLLATMTQGHAAGLGIGEALGQRLLADDIPDRQHSVLAQAYRLGVPVSVHADAGTDPLFLHPTYDGSALGGAAERDFLTLANSAENLEQGALFSFDAGALGNVFLQTLVMARQAARPYGRDIADFTAGIFESQTIANDASSAGPANGVNRDNWVRSLAALAGAGRIHRLAYAHHVSIPQLRLGALRATGAI